MLPSYHHGGSMPGMGSKPLRRPWFQDVNGTLIAILVLAVVLALEHFHFQSRLARVSALEVSLATQLKDVEASMKQHTDQLRKMNPKLDEIDSAELSLKRLQEEASKAASGLADVRATLAEIQRANITAQFVQEVQQQWQNLTALASQVDELMRLQTSGNEGLADSVAILQSNVTKLASKLESHNSALKTLADQLELHQNSTLSALQQQTVAVSEALEAHKVLQERVDNLNMSAAAAAPNAVKVGAIGGAGAASPAGGGGAGMGNVDTVLATSNKTTKGLLAVRGDNASDIAPETEHLRGTGNGTAAPFQPLARPVDGWNATTGVAGAQGAPKLAASVNNTGTNQAAAAAAEVSSVDEDSQLVREHVTLTLDDGEESSNANTKEGGPNTTTAVTASNAISAAAITQAAGSTTAADTIQYDNTKVWTGWATPKMIDPNGTTVGLPTDASSKKTAAGQGAVGTATEADMKAVAQVDTSASAGVGSIDGSANMSNTVMTTRTARLAEGTAGNSTVALDKLDALFSAGGSSRDQAEARKGSTGSTERTSGTGATTVMSSEGDDSKAAAEDVWGSQSDHQVHERVSSAELRRGQSDLARDQGQQTRRKRVRTGRNQFNRMHEQFAKQLTEQHHDSDGTVADAGRNSTSEASAGVVAKSTLAGAGGGAASRAVDALATMGAANSDEATSAVITGSGTGETASVQAADENSGVLVDEEEQELVE
ncbi:hypothetical protein Vafri_3715 [Volvox africanus]|uniref:Uncharacterized protein n=1 Tax=Volvox africanus TaxID=51714 RepID=A0A8J4ASN2_9CHLO|nr:hypothetical protein Vafri_3715 [Volvox africanus]